MKFEFDKKTGMMKPKENPQVYFSRSMSGGLRVDDQINQIKYIIERDETIKFISGRENDVNIYDQRMAHVISDRVKRMFGSNHKYSNYKYFTKGYHVIESYNEFVGEGLWSKGIERSKSDEIRKEDGIKIKFPLGSVILDDKGCGLPYKLNPDDDLYYVTYNIKGEDVYLFGYDDDGTFTYFKYSEDREDDGFLQQIATSDYDMTTDDFILIRAMFDANWWGEDMEFSSSNNFYTCMIGNEEYLLYDDYDNVKQDAIDNTHQILDLDIDKKSLERWRDWFGNDFIDTDSLEDFRREDYESYVNDIEDEDGTLGCRLFDELEEHELIEDTDEYFELIKDDDDDEGYLDYESPLFNIEEKKEELVDELCDSYDDVVEWWIDNFGIDGLENYVDFDKLSELIVDSDGICDSLGCSDEHEFSEDGYTIYIYER